MMLRLLRIVTVIAALATTALGVLGALVPGTEGLLRWLPLGLIVTVVLLGAVLVGDQRRLDRTPTR